MFKLFLIIVLAFSITTTALAGNPEPEAVKKTYKKAEKTFKQMDSDHEKMKGEHKLMFKAWQEKSSPLLTDDEEVLSECKTILSALKDITEQLDAAVSDDPAKEKLISEFEKVQGIIDDIAGRHKILREKHERLFHEMMGH